MGGTPNKKKAARNARTHSYTHTNLMSNSVRKSAQSLVKVYIIILVLM